VPADTPEEIVTRLNGEINKAIALPDINEKAQQIGGVVARMSVDEFAKFFDSEVAVSRRIVTDGNITHEN
jgi:tripartite-type tricarboxylate transporter receptor subunit TctC